jgi:hypothetical protein
VLRGIFGQKRDEVPGDWRKLHEELRDLYSSPSLIKIVKSRRMRCVGHLARMGEKRNAYRLLVGKPERNRPLGRLKYGLLDNIKMVRLVVMDWIGLPHDREQRKALVKKEMNPLVSMQYRKVPGQLHNWQLYRDGLSCMTFNAKFPANLYSSVKRSPFIIRT